jgi:hypothetical protein
MTGERKLERLLQRDRCVSAFPHRKQRLADLNVQAEALALVGSLSTQP